MLIGEFATACTHVCEQAQCDLQLAEADMLSLKSQTEVCNSQLRGVENQLRSRRAELEQLESKMVERPAEVSADEACHV